MSFLILIIISGYLHRRHFMNGHTSGINVTLYCGTQIIVTFCRPLGSTHSAQWTPRHPAWKCSDTTRRLIELFRVRPTVVCCRRLTVVQQRDVTWLHWQFGRWTRAYAVISIWSLKFYDRLRLGSQDLPACTHETASARRPTSLLLQTF